MKAAGANAAVDGIVPEPEPSELATADDAVLARREPSDRVAHGALGGFSAHMTDKAPSTLISPPSDRPLGGLSAYGAENPPNLPLPTTESATVRPPCPFPSMPPFAGATAPTAESALAPATR